MADRKRFQLKGAVTATPSVRRRGIEIVDEPIVAEIVDPRSSGSLLQRLGAPKILALFALATFLVYRLWPDIYATAMIFWTDFWTYMQSRVLW